MAAPTKLPCANWADDANLCSPCDDYAYDAALMDTWFEVASELLFQFSGQQFPGECTETVRPCTQRVYSSGPFRKPVIIDGAWQSPIVGCGCDIPDDCGCGSLEQIVLGRYPIVSIDEVKVDGTVLPTTAYRVDDYRYLVRLDGEAWPCCQDLSLADTEDDTFSVEFTWGRASPTSGVRAAAALACELYMSCNPEEFKGKCRLPYNVTSVTRQGVAAVMVALTELLTPAPGRPIRTGILEVDLFLLAYNRHGNTAPTVVLSPDIGVPSARKVGT